VFKAVGSTPDAAQKLLDELGGRIAPVGSLNRQGKLVQTTVKIHTIQHLFHQKNTSPGRDFFVGKGDFDIHWHVRKSYPLTGVINARLID